MKQKIAALALALCLLLAAVPAMAQQSGPVNFVPFEAETLNRHGTVSNEIFASAEITLLNFWATWCSACLQSIPEYVRLEALTGGDVQMLGLLLDAVDSQGAPNESGLQAFAKIEEQLQIGYPILVPDTNLSILASMVTAIPTTFVIDKNGMVQTIITGGYTAEGWVQLAQSIVDATYDEPVTLLK